MGTKANPGKFDCYAAADEHEPLFVLRAKDPAAPELVRDWALQRIKKRKKIDSKVMEAIQCAEDMEKCREDMVDGDTET